jgi:hypothetical protein
MTPGPFGTSGAGFGRPSEKHGTTPGVVTGYVPTYYFLGF